MKAAEMLANRLRKNRRRLKSKIPKGTDCFRAYDRDIPEVPVVVEKWGPRLRVVEMPGRVVRDDTAHRTFLDELCAAVAEVFEVPAEDVVLRRRARRRQGEQHRKLASRGERHVVKERGLSFWVNLEDYVDCGLFLDHRNARAEVEELAAGRRVLNLFAYTGAFSVAAARGGAAATTSVDLSKTYLRWAGDNLGLNRLEGAHELVEADVRRWLRRARHEKERYGLIVLDPPTLSKSHRMEGDLDVQRDHPELVEGALALLEPGGVLYFSTNLRTFELEPAVFAGAAKAEEITERSLPPDFRDRVHRCWRVEV